MRIAVNTRFLLKNKLEGFGHFTKESLKRMVLNHPDVHFDFLFDRAFDDSFLFAPNVHPIVLPPPARHPFLWYIWFEWSVARWLNKNKPDLFLSTDGYASLHARVPQVTVIHDLAFEHFNDNVNSLMLRYMRRFTPLFCLKSERLATVSEFTKSDLIQRYELDARKIDVVYNGASERYQPIAEVEQANIRARFTNNKPYFLYVGSIHPRKNIVRLLEAFDSFKNRTGSDTQLLMAGRMAWKTGDVQETLQTMKHRDSVLFTGYIDDETLAQVTASARCLFYVSLFEGFGIPIIEAMKSGVPVVCSSNSATGETAGIAALKVDPYEMPQIAEAMIQIDSNALLRSQLIQAGMLRQADFSWEKTADSLWNCCMKALKK